MPNIVLVSGGFDPIHSGHVKLIEHASKYGGVVVLLNSDEWLKKKKGREFLNFKERKIIMYEAIKQMLKKYQCHSQQDYINALKEIFQEIALLGL
mgnify:CR=1 FL=1